MIVKNVHIENFLSKNFVNQVHWFFTRANFFWLDYLLDTSGLQRLAGVHDPPQSCDTPINADFYGDCDGGDGGSGNG